MRSTGWTALALVAALQTSLEAAPVGPAATRASAPLQAAVDRAAADLLRRGTVSGVAITVADRDGVLLSRGYGSADLEHDVPVATDTVFRIGSITKEFTAASILLLADRGKLSLGDPLSRYLPDFPRAGEVTVRELLNHTAGVGNFTNAPDFLVNESTRPHTTAEMVRLIARGRPVYDFAPGTGWNHSNSGYLLLDAIIERVSGQPLGAFMKANIFDPLELADTRLDDTAEIVPGRAAGYDRVAAAPGGFANAGYLSLSVAAGAGGIRSTAPDLVKWHAALLGGRLLKPGSLKAMTSPALLEDGRPAPIAPPTTAGALTGLFAGYGFGVMLGRYDGRRAIGHTGAINGFSGALFTYPDSGLTIAVLTNTSGAAPTVVPALTDAVFTARARRAP